LFIFAEKYFVQRLCKNERLNSVENRGYDELVKSKVAVGWLRKFDKPNP
jgi:hypothetical protein